uniref:Reverse transcriptase n=1 Tax=Solanum tuberosum TaxID=4113 RepID=M1DQG5_SOLTU
MPLSFAPIPEENKFDIANFFWDRKDAVAAQKKTKAALRQSKRKMDLHNRTNRKVVPISTHIAPYGDLIYLNLGPSIQHVDLEVSKYDMSPEDHNLIKHGLPDDGGIRHERSILDNDLINFVQEVSQLYILDKDDNQDSNLLIEETLSGNEEFYDVVEQQSNSDVVEEQSNSSLDEYRESSTAHIDLTEECGIETHHVQLAIYPAKWDRPIQVIAFRDTGATESLLNPIFHPKEQWIPHFHNFNTASKGILTTSVITKNPITIEFFPGVQFRTKLLGFIIPGTDLVIGFDIYKKLNDRLKIKTQGIAFRDKFKLYTTTTRLFPITEDERAKNIKSQLVEESCVYSHREFMKKHDKPLWLNKEFFTRLPFKRNENINPKRASHSEMNPEHLQLAKKKCDELLEYRLIEPSNS